MKKSNNKILLIATYFPPAGGVGTFRITKFAKFFDKFGWDVSVVTLKEKYYKELDEKLLNNINNNINIYRLEIDGNNNGKYFYNQLMIEIDDIIKRENPNVVLCTGGPFEPLKIIPYIKRKYKSIKTIADFRDPWSLQKINNDSKISYLKGVVKNIFITHYEKNIFKHSDIVLTVNDSMTKSYKNKYKNYSSKIYTISNGIDIDDFNDIESFKFKNFTIVYSGKFSVSAGFRDPSAFFKALKKINETNKVDFVHVGLIEEKVKNIVDELGCNDYVKFLGFKSYLDTISYCKGASCLLLISGNEKSEQTGKIFDYIGCNRRIIAITNKNNEIFKICKDLNNVVICKNDYKEILTMLKKELNYKNKSNTIDLTPFLRKTQVKKLIDIIKGECNEE